MRRNSKQPDDPMAPANMGILAVAMTELGWLPPVDAAAVRTAEASPASLPPNMLDPAAVLDPDPPRLCLAPTPKALPAKTSDVDASLRRAAREPGTLTDQVRERMSRDREAGRAQRCDPRRQDEEI